MKKIFAILFLSLMFVGCQSIEQFEYNTDIKTEEEILSDYDEINYLDENFIYQNAEKYKGEIVLTVSTISEIDGNILKCDTKEDDLFFDFCFEFYDEESLENLETEKKVAVLGEVMDKATIGGSVNFSDCHIISYDDCSEYEKKLKKENSKNKETSKNKKISEKAYKSKCKTYSYKKVLRNPSKYIGKKVKVRLKVSQVHEESILNSSKYYFAYSNDEYNMWLGNEYAIIDSRDKKKPKILEDDIIEVYGEIAEPEETKSLIVASSEVFSINMKYAKLIKG